MTEYTELKPLLDACRAENCDGPREFRKAVEALFDACTVETISALIAENERLNTECKQLILLECHGGNAEAAINLLAERDQLKAENEALRKQVADLSPFKNAPLTGPDTKCLACGGYHYGFENLPCPVMKVTAQGDRP